VQEEILKLLVSGNFELAENKIKNNEISSLIKDELVARAFEELMAKNNAMAAFQFSEFYNLPLEKKMKAVYAQFHVLKKQHKYENAYKWGEKHRISKNDLNSVSVKAFEEMLKKKDVKKSISLIDQFNIPLELISHIARSAFNQFFESENFLNAFYIGNKFNLSKKRTMLTGLKGYIELLSNGKITELIEFENENNILRDPDIKEVEEDDIKEFIGAFDEIVIQRLLRENKQHELHTITTSLRIFEDFSNNPLLSDLTRRTLEAVAEKHNQIASEKRGPAAYDLAEKFGLLNENIPGEIRANVIKAAENSHHEMLNDNNLIGALYLKKNYGLFYENTLEHSIETLEKVSKTFLKNMFDRVSIEDIKIFIEEYEVTNEVLNETASDAVYRFLAA